MDQTIARLFDSYSEAADAVNELERDGVPHSHISLVASNAEGLHHDKAAHPHGSAAGEDAGRGASIGGVLGAAGGVLAGLGFLAIPGLGPVVAAGWLVSTVVGAAAGAVAGGAVGGVVGALTGAGVNERDAHLYAEGVRRGGVLVSVRVDESRLLRAQAVLDRHRPVDLRSRETDYRSQGWSRFDPDAPPYTRDQVLSERRRYL
jgi:hypothetical protein